jgi:hypothetical protein
MERERELERGIEREEGLEGKESEKAHENEIRIIRRKANREGEQIKERGKEIGERRARERESKGRERGKGRIGEIWRGWETGREIAIQKERAVQKERQRGRNKSKIIQTENERREGEVRKEKERRTQMMRHFWKSVFRHQSKYVDWPKNLRPLRDGKLIWIRKN